MKLKIALLTSAAVGIVALLIVGSAAAGTGSPIARWTFDNDDIIDSSENGLDGINYGVTFVEGKIGKALQFDGKSYVHINASSKLKLGEQPNSAVSYSFYLKKSDVPIESQYIMTKSGSPAISPYISKFGELRTDFRYNSTDQFVGSSPFVITDDNWHHIVITHSEISDKSKIYVDGRKVFERIVDDYLRTTPDTRFLLGAYPATSSTQSNYYLGLLDDVRIYDKELSDLEIFFMNTIPGF